MDVKNFISSGIIEMYASGLASDEEVQRLEAAMQNSPEIQTAVEACLHDMESYVLLQAVPPPPDLREIVLNKDLSKIQTQPVYTVAAPYQNGNGATAHVAEVTPVRRISAGWKYAAAAAVLLLVGSAALNYAFMDRYKTAMEEKQEQQNLTAQATTGLQQMQSKLQGMQHEMDLLQDPSIKVIKLAGVPTHEGLSALVYWDSKANTIYFNGNRLPAPDAGKQYQLWAIVDGKPVDAGMFNSSVHTVQQMKAIANAQMFAITLEKAGGSPVPTMDQMFVAGKV